MKLNTFVLATLAAVTQAQQLVSDAVVSEKSFGVIQEEIQYEDYIHRIVNFPTSKYFMDYAQQTKQIQYLTNKFKSVNYEAAHQQTNDEHFFTCGTRIASDPTAVFDFFPMYVGNISRKNQVLNFTGRCFDFNIKYDNETESSFDLVVTTSNKQGPLCKDYIFFANTELRHIDLYATHGEHRITFQVPPEAEVDFAYNGIQIFQFCSGIEDEAISLFHTLEAFVGGLSDHPVIPYIGSHTPPYMEKANLDFIYETMGLTIEERPIYQTDVPADYIQSGDFFLILRLDGLDPMIMVGTGSRGAHCVTALRFDGELYIVEAQDAWYWPTAGI